MAGELDRNAQVQPSADFRAPMMWDQSNQVLLLETVHGLVYAHPLVSRKYVGARGVSDGIFSTNEVAESVLDLSVGDGRGCNEMSLKRLSVYID